MNRHRIPAFTMLELIMAMLLTVVVMGITYAAYTIMSHSYNHFQRRSDTIAGLVKINQLLTRDFERADTICYSDSGILVKNDSATIRYEIDSNRIIRSIVRADTFSMPVHDISVSFEGNPINPLAASLEARRLDELSFSVIFEKQKIPYHYRKSYSSANLIERKTHAVN